MKNIFIAILCFMSMAVFASENKDPNQTLFQSAECFGKQGYCEFVDFRGQSSEPAFEEMPAIIDFYTGPTGVNGITCNEWDAVCKNGNSEVMGLNPNFKDEEGNSFKGQSAASSQAAQQPAQQPVQQAAEPPYKLMFQDSNPNSVPGPANPKYLVLVSKVNGLVIQKVVLNQGARGCLTFDRTKYPDWNQEGKLDMGGELKVYSTFCNLIQAEVITNMGSWTHTF